MSGHEGTVNELRFFEDFLMSAGSEGSIKVWNLKSGKEKLCLKPFDSQLQKGVSICGLEMLPGEKIMVSPEGGCYAIIDYDGKVIARAKVVSIRVTQVDEKECDFINSGVSPHKDFLYFVSKQGYLYIFGLKNNKLEGFSKVTESRPISMISHPHKNLITIITDSSELLFLEP